MKRDIEKIIDQIVELIPEVDGAAAIKSRLASIKRQVLYTAPEAMFLRWQDLAIALGTGIPNPGRGAPEWVNKIARIVNDTEK